MFNLNDPTRPVRKTSVRRVARGSPTQKSILTGKWVRPRRQTHRKADTGPEDPRSFLEHLTIENLLDELLQFQNSGGARYGRLIGTVLTENQFETLMNGFRGGLTQIDQLGGGQVGPVPNAGDKGRSVHRSLTANGMGCSQHTTRSIAPSTPRALRRFHEFSKLPEGILEAAVGDLLVALRGARENPSRLHILGEDAAALAAALTATQGESAAKGHVRRQKFARVERVQATNGEWLDVGEAVLHQGRIMRRSEAKKLGTI